MDSLSSPALQILTLVIVYATFFAIPLAQRRKIYLVPVNLRPQYMRLCNHLLRQVTLNVPVGIFIALISFFAGHNSLAESITSGFLVLYLTMGLAALSNVVDAHEAWKVATKKKPKGRRQKYREAILKDVFEMNMKVIAGGAASIIVGAVGLGFFYFHPDPLPEWFWLVCFFFSILPILSFVWSIGAQKKAEALENDTSIGVRPSTT